jgi:hypothetical protein
MSDRGSPSEHTGADNSNTDAGAQASAPAADAGASNGSGDANLSADASSASGDQGAKEQPKATLADVVKTAAELPDAEGKSPAPAKDGKETTVDDGKPAAEKTAAEQAEEDKKLPFHNHPRWKAQIEKNQQLATEVETLKPAAEQFTKIETFMREKNLTHAEVGEGFIIMAMLKNADPRGLQKLDEYRDKLAAVLGEKIPADIQAQIDSGAITEEAGKELSRTRAGKALSDAQLYQKNQADEERGKQDQAERLRQECQTGVTTWEAEVRKTDPDFAKKESAIERYSRALMLERGHPKNRAEAVQLVKDAYAQVNRDLGSIVPQKQPARHVPSAPSSHGAKQAPKSLADAVRQAASQ